MLRPFFVEYLVYRFFYIFFFKANRSEEGKTKTKTSKTFIFYLISLGCTALIIMLNKGQSVLFAR